MVPATAKPAPAAKDVKIRGHRIDQENASGHANAQELSCITKTLDSVTESTILAKIAIKTRIFKRLIPCGKRNTI